MEKEEREIIPCSDYEYLSVWMSKDFEDWSISEEPIVAFRVNESGATTPILLNMTENEYNDAHYLSAYRHLKSGKVYSELVSGMAYEEYEAYVKETCEQARKKFLEQQSLTPTPAKERV